MKNFILLLSILIFTVFSGCISLPKGNIKIQGEKGRGYEWKVGVETEIPLSDTMLKRK